MNNLVVVPINPAFLGTVPPPSILLPRGAINGLIIEQYEVEVNKPGQLYALLPTNKLN
jgi:hypothetical protein